MSNVLLGNFMFLTHESGQILQDKVDQELLLD
jgi:hypothetical protein